jgi:hypothetical protein
MCTGKKNLDSARHLLQVHFAKLNKAIDSANYSECCAALRAIEDEAQNALTIATKLSLDSHLVNRR